MFIFVKCIYPKIYSQLRVINGLLAELEPSCTNILQDEECHIKEEAFKALYEGTKVITKAVIRRSVFSALNRPAGKRKNPGSPHELT